MIAAGRDVRTGTRDAPWPPLFMGLVLVAKEVGVLDLAAQRVRTTIPTGLGPTGVSFSLRVPVAAPAPELQLTLPGSNRPVPGQR
jgi:hypothetical protein